MFLDDLGLDEPGVAKLIRSAYDLLDLQTYFTAGEKEVRAWTIRKGFTAPQSAGVIHTDFEKGFIRAEVMKYADFVDLGSEQAVKEAGKLSVEGRSTWWKTATSCTSVSTSDASPHDRQMRDGRGGVVVGPLLARVCPDLAH